LNSGDVLIAGGIGASFLSAAEIVHPTIGVAQPQVEIEVNPSTITLGQRATLSWSSSNATSCTASGAWAGPQALNGSLGESPAPAGTYVYTLT
jgi:hypothetical protein